MAIQAKKPKTETTTEGGSRTGATWGQALGTVVGAYYGGPSGAMAGGGTGAQIGGLFDEKPYEQSRKVPQAIETGDQNEGGSAIARRAAQKSQNELLQLIQAENALSKLPPELQQEYGDTIRKAKELAMQKQNGGQAQPQQQLGVS